MFDKLSNNLNLLMANARINASELARKTGVPASTIKKIRNCDNPNPTLSTLIPIAQNFSLTVSQLVGDECLPSSESLNGAQPAAATAYLKQLTWQDAIHWPSEHGSPCQILNEYSQHSFALTITEDNWEGFPKDAVMIIDPSLPIQHRHYFLIHKEGAESPVIRQLLIDDDNRYLKPVVTGYQISLMTPQHRIIGTIVEIRKKMTTT